MPSKLKSGSVSGNSVGSQESLPDAAAITEDVSIAPNQSKVAAMFGILRKVMGVKDIINLRLSLPAQLLDPIPNLEHWNYMDRPDYFVQINDYEDPFERMLAVFRWWISKDIKHVEYRVLKPFNSILGEQFFCHWDVEPSNDPSSSKQRSSDANSNNNQEQQNGSKPPRVEYITEQISHHPPISAYCYRCVDKQIEVVGLDHMSAKFSGISATVSPGSYCHGTFVTLKNRNEYYQCIHAPATVAGWMSGSLRLHFIDCSYILCPAQRLALILEYKPERWFGKSRDLVEGRIIRYDPDKDGEAITKWKVSDIPSTNEVLATISGSWRGQILVARGSGKPELFIELPKLSSWKKQVKNLEEQGELESRRVWNPVIEKMLENQYGEATKAKREIEEAQRKRAAEMKERGGEFVPRIFEPLPEDGIPKLLPKASINV